MEIAIACGLSRTVIGEVQKPKEFIEHYPMNSLQKKACYRCEIGGWRFITVKEVPRAQLHARRCGEGELDARLYPISQPF